MPSPEHYTPPGRIGDPAMSPQTDPRFNSKLLQQMATFGMDIVVPETPVNSSTPIEKLAETLASQHAMIMGLYGMVDFSLPGDEHEPKVERSDLKIDGPDGNTINLHVFRQSDTHDKTLPCVVYTHGGGMTTVDTINPAHVRWLTSLALAGVVAIAIDFRNGWTQEKRNPFPAGLNDCAAGVQYIASHKADLKISKIVIQGESGGGNLAIATTLKANREGWVSSIDGVYACCPFISNAWGWPEDRMLKELPSLLENNGYFLTISDMNCIGLYYTDKEDSTNPAAWPYHASLDDLKGLPPHVIHVDELDPLKDEGMVYYQKLSASGVEVDGKVNLGVTHGASMIFRKALPVLHNSVIQNVVAFAKRL